MPLDDVLRNSRLTVECRYDMERLGREYNATVAPSIERSRYERSQSPVRRSKRMDVCKPLTRPVPHGNYTTSPVFNQTLPRSSAPPTAGYYSPALNASRVMNRTQSDVGGANGSLPRIQRSDEENEYMLKMANHKHASRVRSAVAARDGTDAHRAYTEAFLSYTGRTPTKHELRGADQYTFVNDSTTGRDVIVDGRTLSRLSLTSGKNEFYYLKRLPVSEPKQYPPFRKTMAPKMI